MRAFSRTILISTVFFVNILFGNKVSILFTANINATYQNCNCGSNPLGGIDRIKTYIDDFRKNNINTIVIDGGNIYNSYPFIEINNAVYQSLSLLNYDLLAPGVHLFFENKNLYNQYSTKYYKDIINSNSNLNLNKSKDFIIDNVKIRFFGYISPDLFKYSAKPDWLILNEDIVEYEYILDGINVLLYNGYLQNAQKFIKIYKKFDLLLLSSDQQEGIWKTGSSVIVGGGHDAESIAVIEILVEGKSASYNVNYVKMDNSITSDKSILKLFQNINIKSETEKEEF
ncbi:MAG: hypothetical protein KAS18_05165 [Calditrichia bacterium]|nr:hypothetical protein [Calditrichia bacterium]